MTFCSGGIRTHASEETGALNQRLRPLGHATYRPPIWGKLNNTFIWFGIMIILSCQLSFSRMASDTENITSYFLINKHEQAANKLRIQSERRR